jgi:hypothetical protein
MNICKSGHLYNGAKCQTCRIAELEAKLHEIQEIYAGMEGTGLLLPSTQGSYLKHIVKQMYEATLD